MNDKIGDCEKKYSVIYADPPWRYDFSRSKSRSIETHYPTMSVEEICDLKVPCAKDSALFLWATSPKLPEAFDVMEAWGFDYLASMVWDKKIIGMGYYARGRHEHLLIGTRGNIAVPDLQETVYAERRTTHSKKPYRFYQIIEDMMGDVPRIELFARHKREGWDVWGTETPRTTQKLLRVKIAVNERPEPLPLYSEHNIIIDELESDRK